MRLNEKLRVPNIIDNMYQELSRKIAYSPRIDSVCVFHKIGSLCVRMLCTAKCINQSRMELCVSQSVSACLEALLSAHISMTCIVYVYCIYQCLYNIDTCLSSQPSICQWFMHYLLWLVHNVRQVYNIVILFSTHTLPFIKHRRSLDLFRLAAVQSLLH